MSKEYTKNCKNQTKIMQKNDIKMLKMSKFKRKTIACDCFLHQKT